MIQSQVARSSSLKNLTNLDFIQNVDSEIKVEKFMLKYASKPLRLFATEDLDEQIEFSDVSSLINGLFERIQESMNMANRESNCVFKSFVLNSIGMNLQ
jgi:hypothetical protein